MTGVLCALLATLRMESRRVGAILLRGFLSSCSASLLNISLWLGYLLVEGIYTIYHPAPQVTSHWSWTFPPSWGLLVLGLLLFLAVASFHLIVTLLGGVVGGLTKGIIVQIQSAIPSRIIICSSDNRDATVKTRLRKSSSGRIGSAAKRSRTKKLA